MLVRLSIRDIVLIDALDLDFAGGLTTLTGETGAGKSILLDAFVLALGGRGDASLVRAGQTQGQVCAVFDADPAHPAIRAALDLGLEVEGELMLRRVQSADGRTRAFVNDQPVSAQALRAVGRELVEIHCQHDERALVDPAAHRRLVDAHGGLTLQVEELRGLHRAMQAARRAQQEEEARVAKARADADYLRHAHAELEELAPQEGEEERLAERRQTLQRAEKLAVDLRDALGAFSGDNGPAASIAQAMRRLERRAAQAQALLEPSLRAMAAALDALSNAEQALETALGETDFDPHELERNEERLFALRAGARKHHVAVAELAALARRFAEDLALLDASEARLVELERANAAAKTAYDFAAKALSHARRDAAKKLDALVDAELKPLKLDGAHFHTSVTSDEAAATADGIDRVEFWVQTNPGSRPGPLSKVASGRRTGPLSPGAQGRAGGSGVAPTLVFDEIDTGVGGAVADAIGHRLQRLSERAQVLAVTHAPQVAARAKRHLRIAKSAAQEPSTNGEIRVATSVTPLAALERREEIARMLAGARITEEARAAASRLLAGGE